MDGSQPGAFGSGLPAPGWLPDPNDPTSLRYWNGQAWTDQRAPVASAPPPPFGAQPPHAPASGDGSSKKWLWALGSFIFLLFLVVLIALAAASGESDDSITSATVPGATTTLPGSAAATTIAGSPATTVAGAPATTVAGSPATTVAGSSAPRPPQAPVALAACVSVSELSPLSGSRGEVALYQQTLKNLGFDPGDVDGRFGPNTFAAGLAEASANGSGGFGVDIFPDDQAILQPTIARLGLSCTAPAPPAPTSPPAAPAPTSPPAAPAPPPRTPFVMFSDFVSMRVAPDFDPYVISVLAGDRLEVFLVSDPGLGIDPFIRLLDPAGVEIATDDDSGGGLDSKIDLVVGQSGDFTVDFTSLTVAGPGEITVFINS